MLAATLLTGGVAHVLFAGDNCWTHGNHSWYSVWLFGSIVSATDPVAVVAVLKTLGAPPHLQHMIEGESLFNDGTAIVLFLSCARALTDPDFPDVLSEQVQESVGTFVIMAVGGTQQGPPL